MWLIFSIRIVRRIFTKSLYYYISTCDSPRIVLSSYLKDDKLIHADLTAPHIFSEFHEILVYLFNNSLCSFTRQYSI